jgi:hypothetical protein
MEKFIVLKLNPKTARHLAYCVGRSDEANAVAAAAAQAAKSAEKNVRDMIAMIADQDGQSLPDNFSMSFDENTNVVTITARDSVEHNVQPSLHVNGVKEH